MRQIKYKKLTKTRLLFILTLVFQLAGTVFSQEARPFEVLVVGDSHISGQGLKQENKFYFLVKEWLQEEVFGTYRKVNLTVKAHAGSRITVHPQELEDMKKAGDSIEKFHYAEANISTPSIMAQIDVARAGYADPNSVDLVMLSGCITDVLVADIINPFYPEKKLRSRIDRFCGASMTGLLRHTAAAFPKARIVVVGYFPIASKKSDIKAMSRYFLKIVGFPPKLQFIFTNPIGRPFLGMLRNRIAKRSRVWVEDSDREMTEATETLNREVGEQRAIFVPSPIPESASYGTKQPLLWEIGRDHAPNDETYGERKAGCPGVFKEMKYHHYGRLSTRMCELSSVAHPNVAGSKAYAVAIQSAVQTNFLSTAIWERRRAAVPTIAEK